MAETAIVSCACGSIGAPHEIRQCEHYHYWFGDRRLASCGAVIKAVYPKKSFDGVDPAVVEHARERGSRVDRYLTEYLRSGVVTLASDEWQEVQDRVDITIGVVEKWGGTLVPQQIAYSVEDGVATMKDIDWIDAKGGYTIVDLKNTAQPEVAWKLQLGCQAAYTPSVNRAYLHVLHVNPKLYKNRGGAVLLPYSTQECVGAWRKAVEWWKEMRRLEA